MDMGADDVKKQAGDENPAPAVEVPMTREASQPSSPERAKVAGAATGTSTPAQAEQIDEKGFTGNEKCRTAKGQKDIEFGAVVAVFSFAVMLAAFFLVPAGAKRGPENWRLDVLMLLAFASFICGFMLLSMQLLEAKEVHVSSWHLPPGNLQVPLPRLQRLAGADTAHPARGHAVQAVRLRRPRRPLSGSGAGRRHALLHQPQDRGSWWSSERGVEFEGAGGGDGGQLRSPQQWQPRRSRASSACSSACTSSPEQEEAAGPPLTMPSTWL